MAGAPASLKAPDGSVVVTLAQERGGTMESIVKRGGKRKVLDNDLRSFVEIPQKFVANRENQAVGPKNLKVNEEGVRPKDDSKKHKKKLKQGNLYKLIWTT